MKKKQKTHDRIVKSAARLFRSQGIAATGIDAIMADAGLTAGGFYSHFKSKDALIAEAFSFAATEALEQRVVTDKTGAPSVQAFVDSYLSMQHRGELSSGCPFAALGAEINRAGPSARRKAAAEVNGLVARLERDMKIESHNSAPILALSIGALLLARLAGKSASSRILADCRRAARAFMKH